MISITPAHCAHRGMCARCGSRHGRALMQHLHSPLSVRFPSEHGKIFRASGGEGGKPARKEGEEEGSVRVINVDDIWSKLSPGERLRDRSGLRSVRVE